MLGIAVAILLVVFGFLISIHYRLGKLDGLENKMDEMRQELRQELRQEMRDGFDRMINAMTHHEHDKDSKDIFRIPPPVPNPTDDN